MYLSEAVCACVSEMDRETDRQTETEKDFPILQYLMYLAEALCVSEGRGRGGERPPALNTSLRH